MDERPLVGLIMGSRSDSPLLQEARETFAQFGVSFEERVISAHRTPKLAARYADEASGRGLKLLVAAAGKAAHLAGALASRTVLPVIGIPMPGKDLGGMDALLSTVQMPAGIPVATVAIGGAKNAALLALQILALSDPQLTERLNAYRSKMAEGDL